MFISVILQEIQHELANADKLHPPFHSPHEGYAVILEEVRELEHEVFVTHASRDDSRIAHEAVQVAAMCVKLIALVSRV